MKKLMILLIVLLVTAGMAAAQARAGGTMYVAVKNAQLKSGTGWFASNRGTLNYGDRVTVIRISGNYAEVRSAANSSLTGWMPTANLSARQVVAGNTANVSAREVAGAGRGFNQEVETSYRNQNRNLNYTDVDRVEAITVSEADLRRFLEEGRLRMGE